MPDELSTSIIYVDSAQQLRLQLRLLGGQDRDLRLATWLLQPKGAICDVMIPATNTKARFLSAYAAPIRRQLMIEEGMLPNPNQE